MAPKPFYKPVSTPEDIREKAKDFNLDLVFQQKEGNRKELPASCQWCIVINKIGHSAWDKLKDKFTGKLRLVSGTTETVKVLADINSQVGMGVR